MVTIKMRQNAKFLFVPTRWPNLFRPTIFICLLASLNIDSLCSVCCLSRSCVCLVGVYGTFLESLLLISCFASCSSASFFSASGEHKKVISDNPYLKDCDFDMLFGDVIC